MIRNNVTVPLKLAQKLTNAIMPNARVIIMYCVAKSLCAHKSHHQSWIL